MKLVNAAPAGVASRFETSTLAARFARPVLNAVIGHGQATVDVRSGLARGLALCIDPRAEKYYWTGTYELGVQHALKRAITTNSVVWDVGAHIGFFTVLSSQLGARHVHAFEPHPANRARLEWAVAANGFGNITVHPEAVAGRRDMRFLRTHTSSLMASLSSARPRERAVEVRCVTIDELCEELGPPHLIKIDVEGVELEVIRGARHTIARTHPSLIIEMTSERELNAIERELGDAYGFTPIGPRQWFAQ